jgi:hypothetical protein
MEDPFQQITALATKEEWTGIRDQGLYLNLLEHIRKTRRKQMVTERTLKRWRKEALKLKSDAPDPNVTKLTPLEFISLELVNRILRMTQELLDLHLIRK